MRLIRRRGVVQVIGLLAVVALLTSQGAGGALAAEVDWKLVDVDERSAEVAIWVADRHEELGVYVLPAGNMRYLLVAWGEKPSGGHVLRIKDVREAYTGGLAVTVELTRPGPDEQVTDALTYPHQLVQLPAGEDTITVNFIGDPWFGDALGEPDDDDPLVMMQVADDPIPNPAVIWGRARVWEATFTLVVEDGHYHLAEEVITVATGGPEWAEFAVAVTLEDYSSPSGMVVASYEDARDGSIVEIATKPLTFGAVSRPFPDVRRHWAEASIRRGIWDGFIHGYPDGTFLPESSVSRAEFIKLLVASQVGDALPSYASEELPFPDVRDHWVADYIGWALEQDWISADDIEGAMDPDDIISRQEMAFLAVRAVGLIPSENEPAFTDAADIDQHLVGYVAAAVEKGLLFGYPDDTFRPGAGLKRSESVAVIWRVLAHDRDDTVMPLDFIFTFDKDAEGWTGDFTDLPVEEYEENRYELEFEYSELPEELREHGNALRISGINRSDDLFMYVKRQLTSADGIEAHTEYQIFYEVKLASDAPAGAFGVGGPPGEAVWVKVGASDIEPLPLQIIEADIPFYVLNVDKGRQNEDGANALRIGDVAKVDNDEFDVYELKTLDNKDEPLRISSDADGNLWIFVGTDSGFEGRTTLYYNTIQVTLVKVN